jgi:hypothetical protein
LVATVVLPDPPFGLITSVVLILIPSSSVRPGTPPGC